MMFERAKARFWAKFVDERYETILQFITATFSLVFTSIAGGMLHLYFKCKEKDT